MFHLLRFLKQVWDLNDFIFWNLTNEIFRPIEMTSVRRAQSEVPTTKYMGLHVNVYMETNCLSQQIGNQSNQQSLEGNVADQSLGASF